MACRTKLEDRNSKVLLQLLNKNYYDVPFWLHDQELFQKPLYKEQRSVILQIFKQICCHKLESITHSPFEVQLRYVILNVLISVKIQQLGYIPIFAQVSCLPWLA